MGRLALIFVLLASLTPVGAAARPPDEKAPAAAAGRVSRMSALEADALAAINELRQEHGLSRLSLSPVLSLAALGHSQSMAKYGYFSHDGHDGSVFWKRIKPRYRPKPHASWGVGENMVWESPELTAADAIERWMASPPHRKNLLTPAWREVGLGAVRALAAPGVYKSLDVTILTADFGVR